MADLNRLYRREKALHEVDFDYHGFEWIDCHNHDDSTLSYIRRAKDPRDYLVDRLQFHARAAGRLSPGRARTVLVRRGLQQRLDLLRRQQHGQRAGQDGRALPEPRPARLDPDDLSAVGRVRLQAAAIKRCSRTKIVAQPRAAVPHFFNNPPRPEDGIAGEITLDKIEVAVCALLLLAVVAAFGQTVQHEFLNLDDNTYVYENGHVSRGLSVSGIAWAFTQGDQANWIPLTWLSLMIDCQFYDLHAGGHHLTNVLLHAATAMLLFLVLRRMTGRLWPAPWWRRCSPCIRCGRNPWPGSRNARTSSADCSSC